MIDDIADLFLPDEPSAAGHDFYDFGCSSGGNIAFITALLPELRGLGIDVDEAKVAQARAGGHEAIVKDILRLPEEKQVDFVTMAHVLEHLPGVPVAGSFIDKATRLARSFIHIRQPYFDADGYLLTQGLKCYWSDWEGHRNAMTALDFYKVCRRLLAARTIRSFGIYGRGPITDSGHEAILPVTAPVDSQKYKPSHGAKPHVSFDRPVYTEILVDIALEDAPRNLSRKGILRRLNFKMPVHPLYESKGHTYP